ncbi:MAG: hypothetical protein E6Q76_07515 [Rhizobium sp.]|nr:MAG: hypothetical protein E6Q76_07515 [Rhizobium sp.]
MSAPLDRTPSLNAAPSRRAHTPLKGKQRIDEHGVTLILCSRCQNWKPADAFSFKSIATGLKQSACIDCQRAFAKAHYRDHIQQYTRRAAVNRKRRAPALVAWLKQRLPRTCACGMPIHGKSAYRLYHDQAPPGQRRSPMAMARLGYSRQRILEELSQLHYVCRSCYLDALDPSRDAPPDRTPEAPSHTPPDITGKMQSG